ncbi:hypothetical protein LTR17_015440 [Elasticomyces elasticus]|nr:hypothetical protein LTR17_015440 [Elasticomyces elasticus]
MAAAETASMEGHLGLVVNEASQTTTRDQDMIRYNVVDKLRTHTAKQALPQVVDNQSHVHPVARIEIIREEVDDLQRQMDVLELDWGGYAQAMYCGFLKACYEASSEQGRSSTEAAVSKGEAHIQFLQKMLGIDGSGLSSLEPEKQKLREAIQRDSPYGRTGSHRGYGAGALKPGARHLNSNKGAAPAQPAKTEKKAKRPALGR